MTEVGSWQNIPSTMTYETPKAGYLECSARAPTVDGGNTKAYLSQDKIQRFMKYGPQYKAYEAAYCVRSALADPHAILRYTEDEWSGYCYARRSAVRYLNSGSEVPNRPDFVFVVFVTESMKIVEWGFEKADPDDPDLPLNDRGGAMREIVWSR